jgi:two-component system response regulator ChvI
VLDLMMPEMDGLEVCRRIRAAGRTPIVMLTSKDDEIDKILGLEMGADDYVTKPFSTRELVARIRAVMRRALPIEPVQEEVVEIRGLSVSRVRREVMIQGAPVELTATEFELLCTLARAPGRVHSRDQLIDAVYGEDIVVSHRTIDTFVKRLRKKIRSIDPSFDEIETIRSIGYRYRP